MNEIVLRSEDARQIYPIGRVSITGDSYRLEIDEVFRPALKQLAHFSHVMVFWWADQHDNPADRARLVTDLPYAPGQEAGIFACRAEYRPNPLALTTCFVFDVDVTSGVILIPWIDAFDGSPILDLKPYVPVSDRVRDVRVAPWFEGLPSCMEDGADFDFEAFFNPASE